MVSAQDRKRRYTATARPALAGALLAITADATPARSLFVLTHGAATMRAGYLDQLESLLDEIELKERHA